MSQSWVDKLASLRSLQSNVDHKGNVGEAFYGVRPSDDGFLLGPTDAVESWHNSYKWYDYAKGELTEGSPASNKNKMRKLFAGARRSASKVSIAITTLTFISVFFTQLVWKSTTQVCISKAKNSELGDDGKFYSAVVALFYPIGNLEGEFLTNVSPS
jgi:hypothetical protein